jgi:diaminopimelate epimerase
VAAALARGWVCGPVNVLTPAGPLKLSSKGDDLYLEGPAEIVAAGEFYFGE